MDISKATSVSPVKNNVPQQTSVPKGSPQTQDRQDSSVVKLSEQALQKSRAENEQNTRRSEAKAQESANESRKAADAARTRNEQAAQAHSAQAGAKGVNTFA